MVLAAKKERLPPFPGNLVGGQGRDYFESRLVSSRSKTRIIRICRIMSLSSNYILRDRVEELARLLRPIDASDVGDKNQVAVDRAIRLLRPASNSSEHSVAILAKLRQSILNQPGTKNGDSQLVLAKFEKYCDRVRSLNPAILNPFLAIFQPLSFRPNDARPVSHLSMYSNNRSDRMFCSPAVVPGIIGELNTTPVPEVDTAAGQAGRKDPSVLSPSIESKDILDSNSLCWVDQATEHKLLTDLIYVLQVIAIFYGVVVAFLIYFVCGRFSRVSQESTLNSILDLKVT
jgi:hypothetical protein